MVTILKSSTSNCTLINFMDQLTSRADFACEAVYTLNNQ